MLPSLIAEFSTSDPAFKWVMIAVAMGTILYTIVRPMTRKKKDPLKRQQAGSSLSRQRNVERQMESLLVELSEMARQLTAQLDTRSQKLESLMREADEKIAALRRANDSTATSTDSFESRDYPKPQLPRMEADRNLPKAISSTPVDTRHQDIYALADQGRAASDIAAQLNRPRGEIELILALRGRR